MPVILFLASLRLSSGPSSLPWTLTARAACRRPVTRSLTEYHDALAWYQAWELLVDSDSGSVLWYHRHWQWQYHRSWTIISCHGMIPSWWSWISSGTPTRYIVGIYHVYTMYIPRSCILLVYHDTMYMQWILKFYFHECMCNSMLETNAMVEDNLMFLVRNIPVFWA